jgi:hypothetical protein
MKTKVKLLTLLTILLFLNTGCTSDSDESNAINDGGSNPEVVKLIKKIREENPADFEKGAQFYYENDRLTYVFLSNCSNQLYYFEYNNEGKISKRYVDQVIFDGEDFNPDTFDVTSLISNYQPLNFIYQNDRLVQMKYDNDFVDYQFTYNDEGMLEVVEWLIPGIGLWLKVDYTYTNGIITGMNMKQWSTDGSLRDNDDYTFEFDNKINPFNLFVENFGLFNLYTCTGFDYISSEDLGLKLFANNITKVYRNGDLLYSATYQYDTDNYPTRISYVNTNGDVSDVELINYN